MWAFYLDCAFRVLTGWAGELLITKQILKEAVVYICREREREREREGERERERERQAEAEAGRQAGREGGREREREGGIYIRYL